MSLDKAIEHKKEWRKLVVAMASAYDDKFKIYDGYIQEKAEPPKEE